MIVSGTTTDEHVAGDEEVSRRRAARLKMRSESVISSAATWAAAAGALPVPVFDLVALGAVQMKMVADLRALYGQPQEELDELRGLIAVLLGTLMPMGATTAVAGSGSKMALGLGTLLGMASMAAFGSAATYAIGRVFVRHFEHGGLIRDFDAQSVKADLQQEYARARNGKPAAGA